MCVIVNSDSQSFFLRAIILPSPCCRLIRDNSITTRRPSAAAVGGSAYCSAHKCYTTTEFVLLGLGAVLGGVMVGVVGISWFKHSVGSPHLRMSAHTPDQFC